MLQLLRLYTFQLQNTYNVRLVCRFITINLKSRFYVLIYRKHICIIDTLQATTYRRALYVQSYSNLEFNQILL